MHIDTPTRAQKYADARTDADARPHVDFDGRRRRRPHTRARARGHARAHARTRVDTEYSMFFIENVSPVFLVLLFRAQAYDLIQLVQNEIPC